MSPIRVMYDEQIFLLQEFGGISRYFTELIKAFETNPSFGIQPVISSSAVRNQYLLQETSSLSLKPVTTKLSAFFHLLKQVLFNRKTTESIDVVHHTFYLPGFFSRFSKRPKAVTLFDMIPEKINEKGRLWNPHFFKRFILPKADLVFSISNSSASDMVTEYGLGIDTITSYLGVSSEYVPNLPRLEWQPDKYFLFVGNRDGYKDFVTVLRSFAMMVHLDPKAVLLLVGGGDLNKIEKDLISTLGITNHVIQRSVLDKDLPNVYSNAIGLVYPSRYEGFGLPLVEAMASGIPILASDIPVNIEIAGQCASYFPVSSQKELSDLMALLSTAPEKFRGKIESGILRSKDFSWEHCAEITAAEYRRITEEKKVHS